MNGVIGTFDTAPSRVVTTAHPPIIQTMEALDDNGVLKEGLILAKDAAGKAVAYNPGGSGTLLVPVGVLTQELDTTENVSASVIKHGTVNSDLLLVGSSAPDADDIALLEGLGIFAV